jgi:large subunit ribosomal protein L35
MPKLKTKKSVAKRIKIKGSGRIVRGQAGVRHNTGKKRPKRKRNLHGTKTLDRGNETMVKISMPHGRSKRR